MPVISDLKHTASQILRSLWKRFLRPLTYYSGRLILRLWRLVRPTLLRALWANRVLKEKSQGQTYTGEKDWQERSKSYSLEDRRIITANLLSVFESDQNRIRSIGSKARGVLQTAGLVFAGDAIAINLAFREGMLDSLIIGLLVLSGIYLVAAVGAALYVDKPTVQHVIDLDEVLARHQTVVTIAVSIALNRTASISRTNLTEAAIFDIARALVVAAGTLIVTTTSI